MGRLSAIVLAALGLLLAAPALRDDDRLVDPSTPAAQRAIAVAAEVVPGELVDVRRDADNGKWEVTVRQQGNEYEVELDATDMTLLRLDYD